MSNAIPLEWIKGYVDKLLLLAGQLAPDSKMQEATILRADHVMDMVQAWKEHEGKSNSR